MLHETDHRYPVSLHTSDEEESLPCTVTISAQAKRRAFFIRILALLCTCSLSIGSHYASYVLGPLKSRFLRDLGASNTEFSLLISAFTLNSTWTPLVGGLMASRLGTTFTSIYATGIVLLGTILLLLGEISKDVRLMAFGMFVFGLGISPLSVIQETIITETFKSHGLGISMALGLIAGKGAAFLSVRTSYPLTHHFGPSAPFYVATFLAAFSVIINLLYIFVAKWLVHGAGAELEAPDISNTAQQQSNKFTDAKTSKKEIGHRKVNFSDLAQLGDLFWVYVWINLLAGTLWTPFTHLATHIIEQRYGMTEGEATRQASYLLAGSMVLYPACGYLIDRQKNRPVIMQLFMLSSLLTLCCYSWLALPPQWTQTALPAVAAFGSGYGFSPLIVVLLASRIVPVKYVSTVLGVHKSLEQTGSTIFQTLAGLSLDLNKLPKQQDLDPRHNAPIQRLLNTFVFLNVVQFFSILGMARLDKRSNAPINVDICVTKSFDDPATTIEQGSRHEEQALLPTDPYPQYSSSNRWTRSHLSPPADNVGKIGQVRRGEIFVRMCGVLIIFAWVLFLVTAWLKLRSKKDRGY